VGTRPKMRQETRGFVVKEAEQDICVGWAGRIPPKQPPESPPHNSDRLVR